jgi:hypothetical protein
LLRLLDDYDAAIESITFPFRADPEVLKVELQASIPEASGVDIEESAPCAAARLRKELDDALGCVEESVREWDDVRQEASKWNPVAMLYAALDDVMGARRIQELLAELGVKNRSRAVGALAGRSQLLRLLDNLSVQELLAIERQVSRSDSSPDKAAAVTKQELHDSILLGIGLLPESWQESSNVSRSAADRLERIKGKVKCGGFDVFLAHNSQDKELVLRLGQQLRNRGVYPWIDVEQIPPGRWFQDVIQSAVRSVKTAAIVIGSAGIGRWQVLELRAFVSRCVEKGIPLIPVLLPGVTAIPDDLGFLRELNLVKFANEITEEEGISRLVWGITGEKP